MCPLRKKTEGTCYIKFKIFSIDQYIGVKGALGTILEVTSPT